MKRLVLLIAVFSLGGCNSEKRQVQRDEKGAHTGERGKNINDRHLASDSNAISRILEHGDIQSEAEIKSLKADIGSLSQSGLLALLEKVGENRNINPDRAIFTHAIIELANRSPETVMSWFPPEKIGEDEPGARSVMGILAKSRPDILRDWLSNDLSNAEKTVRLSVLVMGIESLGSADPISALAFSKTLPPGAINNPSVILGIFSHYGRISPEEATAAAKANYQGHDLNYALYNIAGVIDDPQDRMKLASQISDLQNRGNLFAGSLSQLLTTDREVALRNLAELNPQDLQATLSSDLGSSDSLLKRLCSSDADAVTKLLNRVAASSSTEPLFIAAVEGLTIANPDQAMELIASIPEGQMKEKMLDSQFRALAQNNPAIAIDQALKLPEGDSRNRAYASIGQVSGELGFDNVVAMANTMKPSDQEAFFTTALIPSITNDPKTAAEFLKEKNLSLKGRGGQQMMEVLGSSLSIADPSYASEWIAGLPLHQQSGAMTGIANQMSQWDIVRLGLLLGSFPENESWAIGVRILVDNIKDSDPETAKTWREQLSRSGYEE